MIWDWMKYVLVRCCTSKKSSSFALSFTRFHHSLGTPLCPLPISSALFPIHKSARMKNHRPKPWNQLWKSMKICTDDNFDSRLNCWKFPQSTFFRTAPLTLTLLLKKKIKHCLTIRSVQSSPFLGASVSITPEASLRPMLIPFPFLYAVDFSLHWSMGSGPSYSAVIDSHTLQIQPGDFSI